MFTAAQFLAGAGVAVDDAAAFFADLHLGRVRVRVASGLLLRVWPSGVVGMAGPGIVVVHPSVDADRLVKILVHELAHVAQWRRLGLLRFGAVYLTDYLRGRWRGMSHRAAYHHIGLEVEARAVAERFVQRVGGRPVGDAGSVPGV